MPLTQEETGKSFFQVSLQRMSIGAAVSAFKRLIEEEEKHIQFINGILKNLKGKSEIDLDQIKGVVLEPTNYFDDRAKSEFWVHGPGCDGFQYGLAHRKGSQ